MRLDPSFDIRGYAEIVLIDRDYHEEQGR